VSFVIPCEECGLPLLLYDITGQVWTYVCPTNHWWTWSRIEGYRRIADAQGAQVLTEVLWTPALLPLAGWWDASQLMGMASGLAADMFPDRSGAENHAIAGGAARATFDPIGMNGQPCLVFDGSAHIFYETPLPASVVNETIMAVVVPSSDTDPDGGMDIVSVTGVAGQDGGREFAIFRAWPETVLYLDPASWAAPGATWVTEVSGGEFTISYDIPQIVGVTTRLDDTGAFHINGTSRGFEENDEAGDPDYTADFFDVNGYSANRTQFGAWQNWTQKFIGKIATIVITSMALSDDDIDRLAGWAAHTYGIALPDDHPYKVNPPLAGRVAV
jgi:hypothetical protein